MPMDKVFIVGLVGNATSFAVYASPIPTFSIICRKKSTEMFSVVPYIFTLLTALLGLYYGFIISGGGMLIMTVNGIGCIFELAYIFMFYFYAQKSTKRKIWKLLISEILFFGCLVGTTMFATHGKLRIIVTGSISAAIAIAMYASPLSIMRTVIRTKNVEAMPLTLSIFLVINGMIWSAYAFLTKDIFIGIPSVGGVIFATGQIVLYVSCKICRKKQQEKESSKAAEQNDQSKQHIIDVSDQNGEHKVAQVAPQRQHSINGSTTLRSASGKVFDLIKEMPNGLAAYRTASGRLFKESPQYVELAKQ